MAFVNIHVHTEFSALDGMIRVDKLAERCKELGQDTMCITDHGTCGGFVKAQRAAAKHGVRFLPGIEAYQVDERTRDAGKKQKSFHQVLYARNEEGYRNLLRLHFASFNKNPRFIFDRLIGQIDWELLEQYGKGLVGTSSCFIGAVPSYLRGGLQSEALKQAKRYQKTLDMFVLEVQAHDMDGQKELNDQIFEIGLELDLPIVATTDAHYLDAEDAEVHDVLLAVQAKEGVHDPNRKFYFGSDQFYIKNEKEMASYFGEDVINNTQKVADFCDDATYVSSDETKIPNFSIDTAEDYPDFLKWLAKKYEKTGIIK